MPIFSPIHSITASLILLFAGTLTASSQTPTVPAEPVYIDVYDFDSVDVQPEFPGGELAMLSFINHTRRYPRKAWLDGVEGRVRCSFVVDQEGRVGYVSVIKGVEESLDREAVRIISEMPLWKAGCVDSVPVPVYCTVTIPFRR